MSVRWITWAWEQPCSNAGEKLTLIALADHAGETGSAFPGCARLAEKTGQDERTIRRHLDALEEAGKLTRERRRRDDGTLGTYTYQLILEPPVNLSGSPADNLTTGQVVTNHRTSVSGSPADIGVRAEPSSSLTVIEPSVLSADDVAFELFWATYGKVGPRKKARECWDKARKKASAEDIQAGLEQWAQYWRMPGAANVKWPQGWLNEERWNDEPPWPAVISAPTLSQSGQALIRAKLRRMQ